MFKFIARNFPVSLLTIAFLSCNQPLQEDANSIASKPGIHEVNLSEIAVGEKSIAIVGATIIDGYGGQPVLNGVVLVKGNSIENVGAADAVTIPKDAEIIDGKGMSVLPGFIDAHFHYDDMKNLPALFLQHGVTSVRDPGEWIETYNPERVSGKINPRLFLCGPHLDMFPPAYPEDAYVVRDSIEAVNAVLKNIHDGASAIKAYFRLPPDLIRIVCNTAHSKGIPVTAHLEITEAMEAIDAGLDGVEHITSFGLSLQPRRDAEKYRQLILSDNNARKQGRYAVWKTIDVHGPRADSLCKFLVRKGTFVSPTLGAFEYQPGKDSTDTIKLMGFNNMKSITGKMKKAGVRIVVGSHSNIPYAEPGWAFQREMELLVESGLTNSEVIVAATLENAHYFGIADRLGSIEKGKIADLVLVKGNPLENISNARNIQKVMLNGAWVN
ncbi:amidohydrolase family protein [Flavihumibacter fluvii]|uniref:amidohydrolase family protein n=1 Tax=Flavihumibacter fluvii TaxID=2838157 RepID=UPI001BDE81BB|nr:amidohydrolase family protein [Flavihumibacter fluvii]ULQ51786.1 amidohydrolase family protein [Flavihumibacter fluvii]